MHNSQIFEEKKLIYRVFFYVTQIHMLEKIWIGLLQVHMREHASFGHFIDGSLLYQARMLSPNL
jgi:hypothetical protein